MDDERGRDDYEVGPEDEIPLTLKIDVNRAKAMLPEEASYLVSAFYRLQEQRMRFKAQARTLKQPLPERGRRPAREGLPVMFMEEMYERFAAQEKYVGSVLKTWGKSTVLGEWTMGALGVGPIIGSGLLSEIGDHASPSHLWSFAGLSPEMTWAKGQKRPFNARLKVLAAFKLGESFVKVCNREGSLYGRIYRERKVKETEANEALAFESQAVAILAAKKIGKGTEAYKSYSVGKLPKAHIHARARRYAVKMFLSHFWEAKWRIAHPGETPPVPYSVAHLGHVDIIPPEVPYPV